ncbi:MAG: decaprenyl-phosphate phosphoribosyltransferase [Bacteroidales bacterium]
MGLQNFLKLIRIKSWVKNFIIFAPLFFSLKFSDTILLGNAFFAFLIFCLSCSIVYIINDINDREQDRLHPKKKNRPLASGVIKLKQAYFTIIIFAIIIITGFCLINKFLGMLTLAYILINIAYSYKLKKIALIDVFTIAVNFIIRILIGCIAVNVYPSHWIIMVTFFLSLFLGFSKRKSEIEVLGENAKNHRKVLSQYSKEALDAFKYISVTITLISYVFYTINPEVIANLGTDKIIYSCFFVCLGLFRYILVSEDANKGKEGDPTTLLFKDYFLQFTIIAWAIFLGLIIYFKI